MLYRDNISHFKSRGKLPEGFYVNKGLRQGCCLFEIQLNSTLNKWTRKYSPMKRHMGHKHANTLLFADDQVMFAEDEKM